MQASNSHPSNSTYYYHLDLQTSPQSKKAMHHPNQPPFFLPLIAVFGIYPVSFPSHPCRQTGSGTRVELKPHTHQLTLTLNLHTRYLIILQHHMPFGVQPVIQQLVTSRNWRSGRRLFRACDHGFQKPARQEKHARTMASTSM